MGEWGGGARHVAENATHLKVMLVHIRFDIGGNLYKNERDSVGAEEMGLLSPCASHLSFALLPRCAHSMWVIQKPEAFHRQAGPAAAWI